MTLTSNKPEAKLKHVAATLSTLILQSNKGVRLQDHLFLSLKLNATVVPGASQFSLMTFPAICVRRQGEDRLASDRGQ